MEMVMFRTSFVFMCWLLLITLPKSQSQPSQPSQLSLPKPPLLSECKKQAYECGNLSDIFYPFWGKDRVVECGGGHPFQLNCHGDTTTTIQIASQNFIVKNINMNDKTMRLVPRNLANLNVCSLKSEDIYVNSTQILYLGFGVYNITVFYDCTHVADFPYEYYFKCGDSYSYYVKEDNETLINQLSPLCKGRLHVPTDAGGEAALKKVLESGFEVNYDVSQDCVRCLGSEGECDGIEKHIDSCYYCSDGSRDCYHYSKRNQIFDFSMNFTIGGIVLMVVFLICIGITCFGIYSCFCKRVSLLRQVKLWLTRNKEIDIESFLKNHESLAHKRYKFSEVKKMTNSFKVKLGEGGFGAVYKGELASNGSPVAVKILNASKGNGEDFINEVASISRTSHVNVVSLLGFCLEGNKKALIYEFMPNGSLDKFICNKGLGITTSLSWDNLWEIAIGIARGLEYLHRGCNTRILHFDIKPHNILLDEKFCPKISDFGLAKLCPRNESIISISDARGTIGYVAPEVWNKHLGGISHKSDVYSYGMMLLEMVGVRENINADSSHTSEVYFPDWIYNRLEQGGELGPNGVIATEENEIAKRMTVVGLWCVQTLPKDRPTMSRVIDMLEDNMNSLEIPPKPVLSSPPKPVVSSPPRLVQESTTSSSQIE